MPDYFKALVTGVSIEYLLGKFEFHSIVSEKSGLINDTKIAKFRGLTIKIKGSNVLLQGSLHKYKNYGEHNYNDFNYSELTEVINDLSKVFQVTPESFIIQNLEFGINIELPFNPDLIITGLIVHKQTKFSCLPVEATNVNSRTFVHNRFTIKVYDKGLQYNLSQNLIRIELKVTKMIHLKGFKQVLLSNLLDIEVLKALKDLLIKTWKEIIMVDFTINLKSLKSFKKREFLLSAKDPSFWINSTRNTRYKNKIKLQEITSYFGEDQQQIIADAIELKECQLFNT